LNAGTAGKAVGHNLPAIHDGFYGIAGACFDALPAVRAPIFIFPDSEEARVLKNPGEKAGGADKLAERPVEQQACGQHQGYNNYQRQGELPVEDFKGVEEIVDVDILRNEKDDKKEQEQCPYGIGRKKRAFDFADSLAEQESRFLQTSQGTDPSAEDFIAHNSEQQHDSRHDHHGGRNKAAQVVSQRCLGECAQGTGMNSDCHAEDVKEDEQENQSDRFGYPFGCQKGYGNYAGQRI